MADEEKVTYETLTEEDKAGIRRSRANTIREGLRQLETQHYQLVVQLENPGADVLPEDQLKAQLRDLAQRIKDAKKVIEELDK